MMPENAGINNVSNSDTGLQEIIELTLLITTYQPANLYPANQQIKSAGDDKTT